MQPLSYPLALALLVTPSPATAPDPDVANLWHLAPTMQALGVELEILDQRELRYVLARPEDVQSDVRLLRRRWAELADAPPLHDAMRFPDRALVNELLSFNRAYRQHLDNRQGMDGAAWWELREAIHETDRLYGIWDTVRDARCDYYYVTVRRQALAKLRDLVGFRAYSSGAIGPHVPVWRFGRKD
jgi:hypothetical protein